MLSHPSHGLCVPGTTRRAGASPHGASRSGQKQDGFSKYSSFCTLRHQPPEPNLPSSLRICDEALSCVFPPTETQIPLKIGADTYMKTLASVEDEVLVHVTAIAEVQGVDDKVTREITMPFEYPPITVQVPAKLFGDKG